MIEVKDNYRLEDIYSFQLSFGAPWFFEADFESWKKSFENDTDGEGRVLFGSLDVKAVYEKGRLIGFVQYGRTAFGFDDSGEISDRVSYPVIRNLYFLSERTDVGELLLNEAVKCLDTDERIYAFFHYFGMSCFARHGKLFEQQGHIEALLRSKGFEVEHENVYYSTVLSGGEGSDAQVTECGLTKGNQQYLELSIGSEQVGGCEVHYVSSTVAYLRWIYINGDIVGKGIGSRCMSALKSLLYQKGIRIFHTDTALDNEVAQRFYEKNGFIREGISRSFMQSR